MPRYAAFLRAINVGGHVVKMDALRRMFETMGCTKVETVIASGNVLFDSPSRASASLARKIEGHLHKKLGYEVATFLRNAADMERIAAYRPFGDSELDAPGNTLYVGFLAAPPPPATSKRLLSMANDVDSFHVHRREVYWLCRTRFSESKFSGNKLEKVLGMSTTLRNVTTVRRIAAKFVLLAVLAAAPFTAHAQAPAAPLATAEGVVRELYRLVTVAPGETTDWEQVRNLFVPQAVIVLRVSKDTSSVFGVQSWIDDFVAFNERARVKERGFSERIVTMKPRVFRDIANVFVLYEAAISDSKRPPTVGIDSIELARKDGRWWIVSITNDLVTADHPVPAELQE